ncbi:MAG TPA: TonB-dependent receptor [Marinilabiliales bacterium]|jgi:outer membrane cobalamin receptor|nr:MAG: hypothetical protein A2W95_13645 [Bacteroidetes bacterium GWA2_40_14]OFX57968.1 MAG: hypothetical protein A2W84_17245 [Bacteroidetes bacterium GWC2_40_13]OFX73403.1 MAG: hypothetical protein A2W96_03820 [Bacteroidetes bacterium GWD2_40_43]OFX94753.1 MAG: hypothetical protein A2W97_18725 [Bacteroidetes bacterium GWE2_40_63]OFY24717.1 MAG: hypothetical protein A2W88_16585 [Bacteroidetes bacterium GWF2_40_13]OFZ27615.1 MAG: hypothetical protein A2437_05785 [Bacteroidetes bacterium RIFOXYC
MIRTYLSLLLLGISFLLSAQKYTISGYITDIENGEKLIGANVYNASTLQGTTTNNYGFYSLTFPKGKVLFTVSFVGYATYQVEVDLNANKNISVELKPTIEIQEVVVEGRKTEGGVESSQMGLIEIPMKTISNLPVLFGEADIIKAIQLLPGVQSGSEGMSGMYVRGGGPDQNLILLDGVPVYNVNHLFGFFSVFNSDAIQNVKLIKGGFPAQYGGRLSSVLDISMKEGNAKKFQGSGAVGIIAARLTLEGPIGENTSYIVSGRRTYVDVLMYPFELLYAKELGYKTMRTGYFFHDVNAKVNHKFSDRSRLYFSTYLGKDKFYMNEAYQSDYDGNNYKSKAGFWWGNITSALRWNYAISDQLFSNTTATFSRYRLSTGMENYTNGSKDMALEYYSGILDWGGKVDFDYYPNPNHTIKFGFGETYHTYSPGALAFSYDIDDGTSEKGTFGNANLHTHELGLYAEDDFRIGSLVKVNAGLRWSAFKVRDKFYNGLEPRVSARFLITEKWSAKGSYALMYQYINLLATAKIGLPTDLWVPATDILTPQKAQQYSLGSVYEINADFEFSTEGFYKTMENLVEYKEGAGIFSLQYDWESNVALGKGWSYGLEFLLMKKLGNLTGWVGYTISKSDRLFNREGQEISRGQKFPFTYDRRHDVSIVISYKLNKNIDMGATWVFGTGNATTLGYEFYPAYNPDNNHYGYYSEITNYESRNNFRMPAYHRLDIGFNFHKEKKWGTRTWSFSVYNAYNRKNPFFINWESDPYTGEKKLYQYSLFPIMPSLSYQFEF